MGHRQQQFTKIVLDVAGPWGAREEVVAAISAASPGWKFAGRLLVQTATHRTFHLDVMDREGALASTAALGFRYESPEVSANHPGLRLRFTAPAGTFAMARLALDAAAALGDAGATLVECRSSGGVLAGAELRGLASDGGARALQSAFVAAHMKDGERFTNGMQSLGLPDVVCADGLAGLDELTSALVDGALKPKAGGRFADLRLAQEVAPGVGREDPRFNPFGRWRLAPWTS